VHLGGCSEVYPRFQSSVLGACTWHHTSSCITVHVPATVSCPLRACELPLELPLPRAARPQQECPPQGTLLQRPPGRCRGYKGIPRPLWRPLCGKLCFQGWRTLVVCHWGTSELTGRPAKEGAQGSRSRSWGRSRSRSRGRGRAKARARSRNWCLPVGLPVERRPESEVRQSGCPG